MRYHALATDYDGTVAHDGLLDDPTIDALKRLKASGRRLLLVTGRELDDLIATCPRLDLFDRVVAENGALVYHPETKDGSSSPSAPPEKFAAELRRRGVARLGRPGHRRDLANRTSRPSSTPSANSAWNSMSSSTKAP